MNKKIALISFFTFLLGIILFAIYHEWFIIRLPQIGLSPTQQQLKTKKNVSLSFWYDDRWQTEEQNILWSNVTPHNLYTLTTSWLNTLDEEGVTAKKVILESVTASPSGNDAYISFDRNPFMKEWPAYTKWMWVEGLLKTIRENNIAVQHIYFLIRNKPLHDTQLEFSHAWPLTGYLAHQTT